jgi:hypothetical protein
VNGGYKICLLEIGNEKAVAVDTSSGDLSACMAAGSTETLTVTNPASNRAGHWRLLLCALLQKQ